MTQADRTKERILASALKLISTNGYGGASTRNIAAEAGVAEVTLFRHFSTKEQLFRELINRASFLPALKQTLPAVEGLCYEDAMARIGCDYLASLKSRKAVVRIMLSEAHLFPHRIQQLYRSVTAEVVNTLAEYFIKRQAEGRLRGFDAQDGARAFLGMFFSYFIAQEIFKNRSIDKKEAARIAREFVGIFVFGTEKGHAPVKKKRRP